MSASRIAAVLILVLTAWLAVEAWLLVAPVLEQSRGSRIAGRIFLPLMILLALAIWLCGGGTMDASLIGTST